MLTKHWMGIVHFNLVWAIANWSAIDNLDKEFIDVLHYYFWKLLLLQQYLKCYILIFVLYPKLKTWITIILECQVIKSEDKIIPYSYNYDLQMRHKYNFGLLTCWVWCLLVICTWEIEEGGTPRFAASLEILSKKKLPNKNPTNLWETFNVGGCMQGDHQKYLIQAIVVEVVFLWTEPWVNTQTNVCRSSVSI